MQLERFRQQFDVFDELVRRKSGVGFTSFREGLPDRWEGYKEGLRRRARARLEPDRWKATSVGTGRILRRMIDAVEIDRTKDLPANNLVAWQNRYGHRSRTHRALLDALNDREARTAFERWAFGFFVGGADPRDAFGEFVRRAGGRYDIVAYLFFLKDSDQFMPIATRTFDEAFKRLGIGHRTEGACSWDNYVRYNAELRGVQTALRTVGVREPRLLDAHSFCWMLARLGAKTAALDLPAPRLEEVSVEAAASPVDGKTTDDGPHTTVTEEQFAEQDERNRLLGGRAQQLALEAEQARLRGFGHPDPAAGAQPVWDQPGRGFDILSCERDGTPRYIEVKAARRSGRRLAFFISRRELRKSRALPNYHFYLVTNVDDRSRAIRTFRATELTDAALAPITYFASVNARRR